MTLYLAYGSNLSKAQMVERCPESEALGAFQLPHYRLAFRGVATIVEDHAAQVPVALYRLSEADEAMLDKFEEVGTLYEKISLPIIHEGEMLLAMTYVMTGYDTAPPTQRYVTRIREGYRDWEMEEIWLDEAATSAAENDSGNGLVSARWADS